MAAMWYKLGQFYVAAIHEMVMDVLYNPKLVLVLGTDVASSKTLRKKTSFTFRISDGAVLGGVENNIKSTSM
jgi:hypothetical protein